MQLSVEFLTGSQLEYTRTRTGCDCRGCLGFNGFGFSPTYTARSYFLFQFSLRFKFLCLTFVEIREKKASPK